MRTRLSAALGPSSSRRKSASIRETRIPIVDATGTVVSWASEPPAVAGMSIRHPQAEALLGGEIDCAYLELRDPEAARAAGAPPGWNGPWRCLAIAKRRT